MKHTAADLSSRYLVALRAHLGSRRPSGAAAARVLGRDLLASGFHTLELARIHERALVALAPSHDFAHTRNGLIRRAGNFFTEALIPVEKVHRATRASFEQLQQRTETLRLHSAAMAKGNRELKREVASRKASEAEVKKGKAHYQKLFRESQLMQKKMQHLTRQVLSAQEDERRVISRELHDEVVQTLVGINVQLAALGRAASLGVRALKLKIADTQHLVEKSVSAVHLFARELRPAVLDDLGLIPALHAYLKMVAVRDKLKINLTASAGIETLDNAKRTVLYRVAQEALTNIGRHAQASIVNVRITQEAGVARMEIHDNGKSFQVPQVLSARKNHRLGLLGMRERVEMMGGVFTIESAPEQGTTVRAEIPFHQGVIA